MKIDILKETHSTSSGVKLLRGMIMKKIIKTQIKKKKNLLQEYIENITIKQMMNIKKKLSKINKRKEKRKMNIIVN